MEIIAHGIDLVDFPRIGQMIERHGDRFINRIFTAAEQAYARANRNPVETYAGRFAAKEAILKLVGTGWRGKIAWTDIEVTNNEGSPVTFDGWCMVTLPNGSSYGPVLGPVSLTLPGGWSINRDRSQNVPLAAPAGMYTYHG